MKTTIDLPEDILHRAKIVAAQRRITLKQLMIQGLNHEIESSSGTVSTEALIEALSKGRNTKSMSKLNRDEIYDCTIFHRH